MGKNSDAIEAIQKELKKINFRIDRLEAAIGKEFVAKFLWPRGRDLEGLSGFDPYRHEKPMIDQDDIINTKIDALYEHLSLKLQVIPQKPEEYKAVKKK